jgi:hypothetical protein
MLSAQLLLWVINLTEYSIAENIKSPLVIAARGLYRGGWRGLIIELSGQCV